MARNVTPTSVLALAILCLGSLQAQAQGNWQPGDFGAFRARIGLFEPDGGGDYWRDKMADWTGAPEDLEDLTFGFGYHWPTSRTGGVLFGMGFYSGDTTQAYRDWVDADGRDISHRTRLETFELTATWVQRLRPRGHGPSPYLGVGFGLLAYELSEHGSFLDFSVDPEAPELFHGRYFADGTTYMVHGLVGVEVPVTSLLGFFVEARYRHADDDLGQDFAGFGTLDLSGPEAAVGMSLSF